MTAEQCRALYQAVQTRPRPEDVAALVLEVLGADATLHEKHIMAPAVRHSYRSLASSMSQDFARATTGVARQVAVASELFRPGLRSGGIKGAWIEPPSAVQCLDGAVVLVYVRRLSAQIGKVPGANDFRADRLTTKAARREAGIYKNARWYNKRWRLLKRMEIKVERLIWNQRKYAYTRIGKSALAGRLTEADIAADRNTSCLIAYLAARMSMRSTFTNTSQIRAFDRIAEVLLERCERSTTTRWDLVAHVMPDERVLRRLDPEQQGRLLGAWWELLGEMAQMLQVTATSNGLDLATMIVKKGMDSSTWNQVAGGWNQARTHWISLLHALGAASMLDAVCPGKVMRAMAADVARWHRLSGGDVHPDTMVWALLPPPWEVVSGTARCTRSDVEHACLTANVDPASWIGGRRNRTPVEWSPTPELVHGVTVASPVLATLLRKARVFSGKPVRDDSVLDGLHVQRDSHGSALYVGITDDAVAHARREEEHD